MSRLDLSWDAPAQARYHNDHLEVTPGGRPDRRRAPEDFYHLPDDRKAEPADLGPGMFSNFRIPSCRAYRFPGRASSLSSPSCSVRSTLRTQERAAGTHAMARFREDPVSSIFRTSIPDEDERKVRSLSLDPAPRPRTGLLQPRAVGAGRSRWAWPRSSTEAPASESAVIHHEPASSGGAVRRAGGSMRIEG